MLGGFGEMAVDKGTCHPAWWLGFYSQEPHGKRRSLTPESCPLSFWDMCAGIYT